MVLAAADDVELAGDGVLDEPELELDSLDVLVELLELDSVEVVEVLAGVPEPELPDPFRESVL